MDLGWHCSLYSINFENLLCPIVSHCLWVSQSFPTWIFSYYCLTLCNMGDTSTPVSIILLLWILFYVLFFFFVCQLLKQLLDTFCCSNYFWIVLWFLFRYLVSHVLLFCAFIACVKFVFEWTLAMCKSCVCYVCICEGWLLWVTSCVESCFHYWKMAPRNNLTKRSRVEESSSQLTHCLPSLIDRIANPQNYSWYDKRKKYSIVVEHTIEKHLQLSTCVCCFRRMWWVHLIEMWEFYLGLVRECFANIKDKSNKGSMVIETTTKGVPISLTSSSLDELFSLRIEGDKLDVSSSKTKIPDDPRWNYNQACSRLHI